MSIWKSRHAYNSRELLPSGHEFVVECSCPTYIVITDDENYKAMKRGRSHIYYGGLYQEFPARIQPPRSGLWRIAIIPAGEENQPSITARVSTAPVEDLLEN